MRQKPKRRARGPRCGRTADQGRGFGKAQEEKRAINSGVECHLHTVEVTGSNPVSPTNKINGLGIILNPFSLIRSGSFRLEDSYLPAFPFRGAAGSRSRSPQRLAPGLPIQEPSVKHSPHLGLGPVLRGWPLHFVPNRVAPRIRQVADASCPLKEPLMSTATDLPVMWTASISACLLR